MISNKKDSAAWDSFDTVVRDICAYLKDPDATKLYAQVSRFLLRVLDQLNYRMIGNIKSVMLTVGDNMTTPLPSDFNTLSKIGVCCGGRLIVLHKDDNLCIPEEEVFSCCTCEEPTSIHDKNHQGCPSCTFHNIIPPTNYANFGDFTIFDNLFRYPYWYGTHAKDWRGTYRIDDHNGQIVFGSGAKVCPGAMVVMEYNSALLDSQYGFIPKRFFPVILHKTATFLTKGGEQQLEQHNYRRELNNMRRMEVNESLEDLVYYLQKGLSSAPRRG